VSCLLPSIIETLPNACTTGGATSIVFASIMTFSVCNVSQHKKTGAENNVVAMSNNIGIRFIRWIIADVSSLVNAGNTKYYY